jgi:dihydrofolate reductase
VPLVGEIKVDMSISVDGFIAGPNEGPGQELGEGGMQLHEWVFNQASWRARHGLEGGETGADSEIAEESFRTVGAVVMGRRMFDLGEEPWGEEPPFDVPVFVVTHRPRKPVTRTATTFMFVTDGIDSALQQAGAAAGDKDISLAGGANLVQQCLRAGLIDEVQLHVAPVLLGDGKRLFDDLEQPAALELVRVADSPGVTHLKYRFK